MEDCRKKENQENRENWGNKGYFQGILYGLLPHSFCIAFIVFTALGSTLAASFFKKALLTPYFFQVLIGLSIIFAMISAVIYLKRKNQLSIRGFRGNLGYLGILLGTTIGVNLLFFTLIFPLAANAKLTQKQVVLSETNTLSRVSIAVNVPCSGHAPLIIGELNKISGVKDVKFSLPNIFEISYDSKVTNVDEMLGLKVFKTFPAEVRKNG